VNPYVAEYAAKWKAALTANPPDNTAAAAARDFLDAVPDLAPPAVFPFTSDANALLRQRTVDGVLFDCAAKNPQNVVWVERTLWTDDFQMKEAVLNRLREYQASNTWRLEARNCEPVVRAIADERSSPLFEAARKLLLDPKTDGTSAVPYLMTLLDAQGLAHIQNPQTRQQRLLAVIEILQKIGAPAAAALPRLQRLVEDTQQPQAVRDAAAKATQSIQSAAATPAKPTT
jgi:hypothetical protein